MAASGRAAEVARELVRRRADLIRHERGSLESHLVGVHDILTRWKQPERVQLAGLLHSGYSTEAFAFRLFGKRDRPRMRELIGEASERLTFAFGAIRREELLRAAEEADDVATHLHLQARWGDDAQAVSRVELSELLVIHAANLAEQSCGARGEPVEWIARARRFLSAAQRNAEVLPAWFAQREGDEPFDGGAETRLLQAYEARLRGPASTVEQASSVGQSLVGEPLVLAGLVALAEGRGPDAASLGARACVAFEALGVSWDKRLRIDRWEELAQVLMRDGRLCDRELEVASERARASLDRADGSPERIWAHFDACEAWPEAPSEDPFVAGAPPPPSTDKGTLPPRFARYIGALATNTERPIPEFYPGLRTSPWYDPREFAITRDLETHAAAIASEMRAFEVEYFQDEAEDIGRTGRWGVLFLLEMGRRNEEALALCPVTASIIQRHRTITTRGGLMYFSCLDPRTRIAPHQGPTNQRLRCHLGLEIPDQCGVRVGGVVRSWEEGRCIVFDDSFWHEVWNNSDRRRVVLILDLWHPDLSDDEVALLAGLHRYGIANRMTTARALSRNDAAQRKARREGESVRRDASGVRAGTKERT